MSRYHSVCETCGMEDPNDGTLDHDCGHPIWAIVDHIEPGHDDEDESDEPSKFWDDLNEDLEDPEFRKAYADELTRMAQEDGFYDD